MRDDFKSGDGGAGSIESLVALLAKLPGLGPRSARRAALYLLKRRDSIMQPLARALDETANNIKVCKTCNNLDVVDPCGICTSPKRERSIICVVEDVGDLWAMERVAGFRGLYHVLGGTLSALDGIGPDDLAIGNLVERASNDEVTEVIIATNATVDGQTTAHYIADVLADANVTISGLAHGVPVGGEIDYLDEGTLGAALKARKEI
ncbi:MAG: recombination mediator RecR [Rhodospirillaceae bacterium]|nr:recombination mediator RecR [Rhodospirillaceae bacterium]